MHTLKIELLEGGRARVTGTTADLFVLLHAARAEMNAMCRATGLSPESRQTWTSRAAAAHALAEAVPPDVRDAYFRPARPPEVAPVEVPVIEGDDLGDLF